MSEKKVMVIDGKNLFSRLYYAIDRKNAGYLESILNSFLSFREKHSDKRFVFTFDTCKSERRCTLYPEYKARREEDDNEEERLRYRVDNKFFIELIKACGFISLEGAGYEADDYIACVASMLKAHNHVILVSTDKDLLQLIGPNIVVFEPTKGITIDEENFKYVMDIEKKYFLDYKCMVGENSKTSDNIPGIFGIGPKSAKKLIEEYGGLQAILDGIAGKSDRSKKEIAMIEGIDILNRNIKLMSLRIPILDEKLQTRIKYLIQHETKSSKDRLHELLGERNLGNLYKNFLRICFV